MTPERLIEHQTRATSLCGLQEPGAGLSLALQALQAVQG